MKRRDRTAAHDRPLPFPPVSGRRGSSQEHLRRLALHHLQEIDDALSRLIEAACRTGLEAEMRSARAEVNAAMRRLE
jgi:hypothetical protein